MNCAGIREYWQDSHRTQRITFHSVKGDDLPIAKKKILQKI